MKNPMIFQVHNVKGTIQLASRLAAYLQPGCVITLEGELGAGKTSFTKGIAKGLKIDQVVNSPTFTLIKEYNGKFPLYHMDVYRLENGAEDIGFDDYFYGDGITVIEWAVNIQEYLPEAYLNIKIEKKEADQRSIIFEPHGELYIQVCEEFMKHENFSD